MKVKIRGQHENGETHPAADEDEWISWTNVQRLATVICLSCLVEIWFPQAYGKMGGSDIFMAVDPRLGWWIMELPCTVMFILFFWRPVFQRKIKLTRSRLAVGLIFSLHYAYRGWYFPLSIKVHPNSKGFSLFTAVGGWIVTITHGYLNAKWFGKYGASFRKKEYVTSVRFLAGVVTYYTGLLLVMQCDQILRDIRNTPGAKKYEIPHGGLWDYATSAQYLAELVFWFGFWMLSDFGPNGAFIFFVSVFNLVPRSQTNYDWYVAQFGEEFTRLGRAKLIPGVW